MSKSESTIVEDRCSQAKPTSEKNIEVERKSPLGGPKEAAKLGIGDV